VRTHEKDWSLVEDQTAFSEWSRARRKALGQTQFQLAERAGCAEDPIGRIEVGPRRPGDLSPRRWPFRTHYYETMMDSMRALLGPDEFEALQIVGQGLRMEAAIACALAN
jgi:transcriptional regulator with XRE-family HTH domain